MGILILLGVGFMVGLKCTLFAQAITLILFAILLFGMAGKEAQDVFVVAILVWILMLAAIGVMAGNIYFYNDYYHGPQTIWSVFSWFFKP